MKYLLKTDLKQNTLNEVSISLKNEFTITNNIRELILHLFNNAAFIESYEIYILQEFEPIVNSCCSEDSIKLSSPNSQITLL